MSPTELLERAFAAYDARDLSAYLACWHDDAVYVVNSQEPIKGREAIAAQTQAEWTGSPDMRVNRMHFVAQGDWAAWRWHMRGTHDGDYGPLKATHRAVSVPGACHARIVNGRVAEVLMLSDRATMFAQLGLT